MTDTELIFMGLVVALAASVIALVLMLILLKSFNEDVKILNDEIKDIRRRIGNDA